MLPPGPLHKRRKYAVARFLQGAPDFKSAAGGGGGANGDDGGVEWRAALERPEGRKRDV